VGINEDDMSLLELELYCSMACVMACLSDEHAAISLDIPVDGQV
jgi:hypothetical protein